MELDFEEGTEAPADDQNNMLEEKLVSSMFSFLILIFHCLRMTRKERFLISSVLELSHT